MRTVCAAYPRKYEGMLGRVSDGPCDLALPFLLGFANLRGPSCQRRLTRPESHMTYVVTENCIKCKYMDCVEVCPVDCFYEGENMLVIHPDECIDCGVCEPECPAEAIKPDTEPGLDKWLSSMPSTPRPGRTSPSSAMLRPTPRIGTASTASSRSTSRRTRARATERLSPALRRPTASAAWRAFDPPRRPASRHEVCSAVGRCMAGQNVLYLL